ncbi:Fc.00g002410.m01.CDS01 [Cosmosporella sp. VM-42]
MDSSERERAVASSIKEIVKHTSRRKATIHLSSQRAPILSIAPKSLNNHGELPSSGSGASSEHSLNPISDPRTSQEDGINLSQDRSTETSLLEDGDSPLAESMISLPKDEFFLIMQFLDHVFPLQYPLYNPGILEAGRGWLLQLILQSQPLYHAALAFSAYHRRATIFAKISHPRRASSLVQQEKHLEICIKSLSQSAQNSCPKKGLGVAFSVVQMMFFELFTGHSNAWQAHLRAAMNMYRQSYKNNLAKFGLEEESRKILNEDLPPPENEGMVTSEVVTFRFFSATMIWLDIISSITAGIAPYLLGHHSRFAATDSRTKLEDIMGCKNSVMFQIGRIAALYDHKTRALQQGDFGCTEFEQAVVEISRDVQRGLSQYASECDSVPWFNRRSDPPKLLTNIFRHMASVYLHLVTHGFQKLEALDDSISRVMKLLQTQTSTYLLPALVAPLFIVGSVAREGDEPFFRHIFSSQELLDPSLEHRGKILPILEDIWMRRRVNSCFAWGDSLELTTDILLV